MKCRVRWHLIRVYTVCYYTLLGLVTRRIDIGACERQKGRPACTFAKSDQPLYFSCATTLLEMQTLVRSNIMQHLIWVCTVYYLLMSSNAFQMECGIIYINPTNEHYYTSRHIGKRWKNPFCTNWLIWYNYFMGQRWCTSILHLLFFAFISYFIFTREIFKIFFSSFFFLFKMFKKFFFF